MTDPLESITDPAAREQLSRIRALFGQTIASSELQSTVKGFTSQKGIYKPAAARYPLWIRQTAKGVYPDQDVEYRPDGSWTYRYAPEGRGGQSDLTLDTNRALLRAAHDRVPIGVFRQTRDVERRTAYEVLGLAFVESYDGSHFILRGEAIDVEALPLPENVTPRFEPFEVELPAVSEVLRVLRNRRFGVVVRQVYHERCSLCNVGYRLRGQAVGVEAAHIIPVEARGKIGDVRNGILLCRNHHSLFDQDAWSLDEELRVKVAPDREFRNSALGNHILGLEGKRLQNLPTLAEDLPADAAIKWRLSEFERAWG